MLFEFVFVSENPFCGRFCRTGSPASAPVSVLFVVLFLFVVLVVLAVAAVVVVVVTAVAIFPAEATSRLSSDVSLNAATAFATGATSCGCGEATSWPRWLRSEPGTDGVGTGVVQSCPQI